MALPPRTKNGIKSKQRAVTTRRLLLICGILSSLLYVAMNIIAAMQYEGYSSFSQTVSELSAIASPTRAIWNSLVIIYTLLVLAFGFGVCQSANGHRALWKVGSLIILYGIIGFVWIFAPMHTREVIAAGGGSISDTMHIVLTFITVPLMLLIIGIGASSFGLQFRLYSFATLLVLILFGALTGMEASRMEANLPTPWMGVWERISIGAYLVWIVVLAIMLLQREQKQKLLKMV